MSEEDSKCGEETHSLIEPLLPKKHFQEEVASYHPRHKESSLKPTVKTLREGLPISEYYLLQKHLSITEEELSRYLGLSTATLHRRKKSGHLETPESERILRIARLYGICIEVMESPEAAREWLKAPNPGTADESPLSYADTEFGAREVEYLLGRIDAGVFN